MNSRSNKEKKDLKALDEMVEVIIVDAYGDDEQLWAFRQTFEDDIDLPADGFVIGEPVSVMEIDYDGNERRGLTARCRREDGSEYVVAASEVVFPEGTEGAWHIAAYRRWLNINPFPARMQAPSRRKLQHKATVDDIDLSKPVELIVLSVKERAVRCRLPRSEKVITLRPDRLKDLVPGEIVTVKPQKMWRFAGHPYLSGEIQSARLEVEALQLAPLGLQEVGIWDPREHYWGEENDPIEPWAEPIIAHGPRSELEMEQVVPGQDPDDLLMTPLLKPTI